LPPRDLDLQRRDAVERLACAAHHPQVMPLCIHFHEDARPFDAGDDVLQHSIEPPDRDLLCRDEIEVFAVPAGRPVFARFVERVEFAEPRNLKLRRAVLVAKRDLVAAPERVGAHCATQFIVVSRRGLEAHDASCVADLPEDSRVRASIGSDVEHAIDVE
jgi:hypothetical protein